MPGPLAVLLALVTVLSSTNFTRAQTQAPQPPTLAAMVDHEISTVEKQVIDAAEAMPEEKFNFTPESLSIPGDDYKGVRSFAVQIRHIASSNYFLWSPIAGDAVPANIKDGNGPVEMKSKPEILKFLKESFALGHKAAGKLTPENMLQPYAPGKSLRLDRVEFGVAHAYNHYGQMVEYLRMNGIVPPASRGKGD